MTGQPYDDAPDQPNRYNTHADPPLDSDLPAEEDVSAAKVDEQLDTEPEEARNATDPEDGPPRPKPS
jgi:hypothetical protein